MIRYRFAYAIAAVALVLAACESPATPTPTPIQPLTEVPTQAAAQPAEATPGAEAPSAPAVDDDWARIKAAGKMMVGTSADYAPFAYYDSNFKIDGFDIALMSDLARRMGIAVEFNDFAFEGLPAALQLKQVDAAIAAISVTPARQTVVDFSNTYYVGQNGVLAATDASVQTVDSLDDMAGNRIGVLRGSVYETWSTKNLVDTGLVPAANLQSYTDNDSMVRDLKASRIDLAIMDLLPAMVYVNQQGVKLVGKSLDKQYFAIAVRKGQAGLQSELNKALGEAQSDGTVASLIQQYLKISPSQVEPLPTPEPTAVAQATAAPVPTTAPAGCIDGMAYVQDLSYDDQGMTTPPVLNPGQGFQKGWRVQNSGTCDWTTGYALVFVNGNATGARMSGQTTPISQKVSSGGTYDLYVNLIAPAAPGIYQGIWQMRNADGTPFGEKIWAGITVPGAAPAPTQTPAPDIYFAASAANITAGQPVVFTWRAQNVNAVYFYQDGQDYRQNGVAGQDSRTVYPQQTSTYYLRVEKRDGSVDTRAMTINVQQATGAPQITRYDVNPTNVPLGQCVQVIWNVQGNVTRVTILRDGMAIWDMAPVSGSTNDCPTRTGNVTYSIAASGPGGQNQAARTINVYQGQPAYPTPVP